MTGRFPPSGLPPVVPLLLLLAAPRPAVAMVVAVDEITARAVSLSPALRQTLTEFLAARVAALPGLRVIPRPEVRAALETLKREAAARCAEAACPVELGRELAASKVLIPELARLERCVATLTLYDVKTATAEAAVVAQGECDEPALAHLLSRALDELGKRLRPPPPAAAQPGRPGQPPPRLVSVYFSSRPLNAPLLVDGEPHGETPVRVDLEAGRRYWVQIKPRFPYGVYNAEIVATDWMQVRARLTLEPIDPRELASTTEWGSLGLGSGVSAGGRPLFSFLLRLATLKWRYLCWTILDLPMVVAARDEKMVGVGMRAAFPLQLGSTGKHQLLLSGGLHYVLFDLPATNDRALLSVSPGLEYNFVASNGTAFLGGEIRAVLPAAGELAGIARPYLVLFAVRVGFSISPLFSRARREAASSRFW